MKVPAFLVPPFLIAWHAWQLMLMLALLLLGIPAASLSSFLVAFLHDLS
jgi:hypothetical protein